MGSMLSKPKNVVMLGPPGAGKSTLLRRISLMQQVPINQQTIDFVSLNLKLGLVPAYLIDASYFYFKRRGWQLYFEGAKAIIMVVDPQDPQGMQEATLTLKAAYQIQQLTQAPLLVFVAKSDLKKYPLGQVSQTLGLDALKCKSRVVECSGVSGEGIQEGLGWLGREIG